MFDTLVDRMPIGNIPKGNMLVSVEHVTEGTISILNCGPRDLSHLGCPPLGSFPENTVITATDDEGERHVIKILKTT